MRSFHLGQCFQISFMLWYASVLYFFLLLDNIPLYGCTTFYLPIQVLVDIQVFSTCWGGSCLCSEATVNNTAMSFHVQLFVWMYVYFFPNSSRSKINESNGNSMFNVLRNYQTVLSKQLHHCMFPAAMQEGSSLSTSYPYLLLSVY